jgi:tRNA-uridine 2-sulfurtransferase
MKRKAVSLLSGGLDSTLSTRLIMDQGIDVVALHFTSPFASRKDRERGLQAERTARELSVPLIFREKGDDYLEVVRNPRFGYGKNMNPCIDCRIFMLRLTKTVMEEVDAGFVVTGEVLGQRPMSQMRDTIMLIERESGLEDLLVRPLSAQRFAPSLPEREGVVDRERLLGISGRSRRSQNELAKGYRLTEFGYPAGGCLLTDPIFAVKLRDLFAHGPGSMGEVELLTIGRHFRLDATTKVVLGRNKEENERLSAMTVPSWIVVSPVGFKGPQGLIQGPLSDHKADIVAHIIARYSKEESPFLTIEYDDGEPHRRTVERKAMDVEQYLIQEEK